MFSLLTAPRIGVFLSVLTFSVANLEQCLAQSKSPAGRTDENVDPKRLFEPREFADKNGEVLKYRLLKPSEFDPATKYPLVVFLHGAGERGDDNTVQLVHGMADFCSPEARQKYKCYVLAPQCPKQQRWANLDWRETSSKQTSKIATPLQLTFEVIDVMLKEASIDPRRIYITGLSMGGFGTWDAMARRPELFAAGLPICGGGDPATASQISHIPIWCFHGGADRVVPVEQSKNMIAALKKAGAEPKYTEYEGVGHDSWTATYRNPATLKWLFSQKRPVNH